MMPCCLSQLECLAIGALEKQFDVIASAVIARMGKSQVNEYHNIILQVYFNSWQFESYDSTKLTMIESILEALDKDINTRKDVFERADDLLARINFLKVGVFILKKHMTT